MIGERLRFAREKRGLTLNQVADLSAIGSSSLSDFENDKRQPKLAQLQALAKLYGRSEAFFFQEGTLPAEQVLWRQRPVGDVASAIESQFVQLCALGVHLRGGRRSVFLACVSHAIEPRLHLASADDRMYCKFKAYISGRLRLWLLKHL